MQSSSEIVWVFASSVTRGDCGALGSRYQFKVGPVHEASSRVLIVVHVVVIDAADI